MRGREDELREQAIEAYDVLGTPPRRELEELVALAAKLAGAPRASIDLFTASRQWQVAAYGVAAEAGARADSPYRAVLEDGQPIVLPDAGELGTAGFYAAHPLVTPDGVVIGALCVVDDRPHPADPELEGALATLAARVVDVLQLELTSRELAAADEQLGAFADQVSHDLRNPLSAVRMSLELAREELGEDGDPGLLSLLQRALRGTRRMDEMISELVTFARVGVDDLELTDVDLAQVVGAVMADLAGTAPPGQIEPGELPIVRGDAAQLRLLLHHLLANAVTFSPPGDPVTVTATPLGSGWRISVADRGPGVPSEDRHRVFDPMAQVAPRARGTNLGLATCRRIVEAHGGRIGVAEGADGGAALWFELPG